MRISINKLIICLALSCVGFTACKKWDDHNAVTDAALSKTLLEQVKEDTSLSKFSELLVKSGYDKVIASSKTFTVYAPTNAALAGLDASIVNDSAKLKAFVANHIATQTYFTTAAASQKRIQMLNGKYQNLLNKAIDDATIVKADKYTANGVLQVIDKMLPVLSTTWETVQNNPAIPAAQKSYLMSLFRNVYDLTNAVQIGINPTTGDPVYQPGTDSIQTNVFWRSVFDLRNESKQYTLFVLTDAAWTSELNKFRPYCATATNNVDSTTNFASWAVVKDLAIEGVQSVPAVTDTVVSKFGVKVPFEKAAIVQTIKTSNGVVYIMNKVDVQPKHKILPITVQGEDYSGTYSTTGAVDKRGNTYFRDRLNTTTGKIFRDVLVTGHGVTSFNIKYRLNEVYSGVKYKVYWVALNDMSTSALTQKLSIGSYSAVTFTLQNANGYTTVNPNVYTEVLVGETTLSFFRPTMDMFLTANGTGAVVCDYFRLEPQL